VTPHRAALSMLGAAVEAGGEMPLEGRGGALDAAGAGAAAARLMIEGLASLRREEGTMVLCLTQAGRRLAGKGLTCLECGVADPPADQTCGQGRDHRVGTEAGCPSCGRLVLACHWRPCAARRA
jgi:hypothetical protein